VFHLDRLVKLKARPFLAEDTLIEPPKGATTPSQHEQQQQHQQHPQHQRGQSPHKYPEGSRTRLTGSPKNREHGAGRSPQYRDSSSTSRAPTHLEYYSSSNTQQSFQPNSNRSSPGSQSSGRCEAAMSSKSCSPPSSKPTMVKAHVYNLEDLPRSPRYYTQQQPQQQQQENTPNKASLPISPSHSEPTYKSLIGSDKYQTRDYYSFKRPQPNNNHTKSPTSSSSNSSSSSTQLTSFSNIHRHTPGRKYKSYDKLSIDNEDSVRKHHSDLKAQKSAPYYKKDGQFDFSDGCVQSSEIPSNAGNTYPKAGRPYSNPELDDVQMNGTVPGNSGSSAPPRHMRPANKQGNYSSPNIYDDSERMYSEQKELTLTPYTHSSNSLSKEEHRRGADDFIPDSVHSPLHVTLNNSSVASSSTISPVSYLTESDVTSSASSSQAKEEVCPADIASRLFTLNGYKESDVAPLLGKK